MAHYQEECDVDSFAYDSVLKSNLSSANVRETLVTILAPGGLGYFSIGMNSPLNNLSIIKVHRIWSPE